jgi:hypothetical protein
MTSWWEFGEWTGHEGNDLHLFRVVCAFCNEKGNFERVHREQKKHPTLHWRRIGLRSFGRTSVCESPWRRRTPGALCCRSGSPPIPAAVLTGRKYSKGSPLTVFFRPRFKLFAQNRSEGRSVLRWYPPGVKLIVHNSASVPIQPGTQFYAGSQFSR